MYFTLFRQPQDRCLSPTWGSVRRCGGCPASCGVPPNPRVGGPFARPSARYASRRPARSNVPPQRSVCRSAGSCRNTTWTSASRTFLTSTYFTYNNLKCLYLHFVCVDRTKKVLFWFTLLAKCLFWGSLTTPSTYFFIYITYRTHYHFECQLKKNFNINPR